MNRYTRRCFLRTMASAPMAFGATSERGKTFRVDSEIKEYKDPETGARVRQLTGDGSDNVHLYFTTDSFISGSDRVVFGSNRSGRFQYYLMEVKEKRLVQLTDVAALEPQQGSLGGGRLFYFDGPALHCLRLDNLEDRELYRAPKGFKPHLSTCTADGSHVAFAYGEELANSTE